MRQAEVFVNGTRAGILIENSLYSFEFIYDDGYTGLPVSLRMPVSQKKFSFPSFPPFFEGLLPEGIQLEALLRDRKINRGDHFGQLMVCGADCVGAVAVKELK